MKEYVDREKVIEVFENSDFDVSDCDGYQVTPGISIKKFYDLINSIPNADVQKVKHGRWIWFLDGDSIMPERYYKCSVCGRVEWDKEPYCHCGAKMDLEE